MEIRIIHNIKVADLNIIPPNGKIAEMKTKCQANAEQLPGHPAHDR
jgi:hypothetical protein